MLFSLDTLAATSMTVAAVLALRFPGLAWRVPPPPEFYDPEPRQMLYFDSIALGLMYLERTNEAD
jgi:hypothetical protein